MNFNEFVSMVFVKTDFAAVHNYPDAPDEVAYLRDLHRHVFHVTVSVQVYHDDREIEFIMLKESIKTFIQFNYGSGNLGAKSCEMIAKEILAFVTRGTTNTEKMVKRYVMCTVSEDNENGATVEGVFDPWE